MFRKAVVAIALMVAVAAAVFAQEPRFGMALDIPKKVSKDMQGVAEALPNVFSRGQDQWWKVIDEPVGKLENNPMIPAKVLSCVAVIHFDRKLKNTGLTVYYDISWPPYDGHSWRRVDYDANGNLLGMKEGPDAFDGRPELNECFATK